MKGSSFHAQGTGGAADGGGGPGTCFNCGGKHTLRDCPDPRNGTHLPFAMCFVCNSKGHLIALIIDLKGCIPRVAAARCAAAWITSLETAQMTQGRARGWTTA
jgi:hypothetical protein